jgi:hypothetical protein
MNEPARLFLVRPEDQPTPDANVAAIAKYMVWLLFRVLPREHFLTRLFKLNLPDLFEVWYWFNEANCTHRIVFLGDNLPSPDVINVKNYDPYNEHAYYWFPLVLYHTFSDTPLPSQTPTLEEFAARLNMRPNGRHQKWLQEELNRLREDPDLAITRYGTRFWSEPLIHLLSDPLAIADTTRELSNIVLTEMAAISEKSLQPSSVGNSWEATLMLLEYANRIPAVRVPVASRILQVTEKTVYNQCGKNLECIPRGGTTWVTKQSIQAWVNKLYHPTAQFNLWDKVIAEMEKHPAGPAIMHQEKNKCIVSQPK